MRSDSSPIGVQAQAELYPDRIAVVDPDGSTITFRELAAEANRLSHGLRALGVEREGAVALATHNHHTYFSLAIATGQIGGYMVPVNWHLTADEMQYIVENSGSQLVVVGAGLHDAMTPALDALGFPADRRFSSDGSRPAAGTDR